MRKALAVLTIVAALPLVSGLTGASAASAVTQVDDTKLVTLRGNTPVQALDAQNDRGRISDSAQLEHMILVLRRSDTREAALERTIAGLTDRKSPNYHRWLSADEIGAVYGPPAHDVERVSRWLDAEGFSVNRIYPSRMAIDFSGTAGQVGAAFHTEIHRIESDGHSHIANISDPRIPAALVPTVAGIVSLHDFHGHQASHGGPGWTVANCGLGSADLIPNCYFMTAPDVATVYDLNPLFSAKTVGTGQTIAVAEDSDIYSTNDWTMFRSLFGLSGYKSGSVAQTHPGKCGDPGTNGDDFEAILDAEYASAAAPGAAIQVASCADSKTTWGLTIAVENLVNSSSPPSIMSVSYIWCETNAGAANDKAYNDAFQQAVAEGTSVFVASGDEGAAACDYGKARASNGIAVNGIATTPYDVAVGGTDFGDTYHGENAAYWSSSNSSDYGSAKSRTSRKYRGTVRAAAS